MIQIKMFFKILCFEVLIFKVIELEVEFLEGNWIGVLILLIYYVLQSYS